MLFIIYGNVAEVQMAAAAHIQGSNTDIQTYSETNSLEEFPVHEEHGIGPRVEQTGQVNEQHLEGSSLLEDEVRHKFISSAQNMGQTLNTNYEIITSKRIFELPSRLEFLDYNYLQ